MKTKYVSTQKELNKLIESNFDGLIKVRDTQEEIDIFENGKALIDISGSAHIRSVYGTANIRLVSGSAHIKFVSGSAQIGDVYDSAQIGHVYGTAHIRSVYGTAHIKFVSDSAHIGDVYGSAQIGFVYGSAQIGSVSGSAQIGHVSGSAHIGYVYGTAHIRSVYGTAHIKFVSDSAQIGDVYGSAQIGDVYDSAQIGHVYGTAHIGFVSNNAQLTINSTTVIIQSAKQNSILICYETPKIKYKQKTVKIIKTKKVIETYSVNYFIDKWKVEKEKSNYLILYKSVNPKDNTDFYTGKIKYDIGASVIAPDWDNKYTGECGKGLHLSPTPFMALQFNKGRILKCKVKKSDCRMVKNPQYPTKIRCKKVEVLEEVKNLF